MNKKLLKFSGVVGGYITYCALLYGLNKLGGENIQGGFSAGIIGLVILSPSVVAGYNSYQRHKKFKRIRKNRLESKLD